MTSQEKWKLKETIYRQQGMSFSEIIEQVSNTKNVDKLVVRDLLESELIPDNQLSRWELEEYFRACFSTFGSFSLEDGDGAKVYDSVDEYKFQYNELTDDDDLPALDYLALSTELTVLSDGKVIQR